MGLRTRSGTSSGLWRCGMSLANVANPGSHRKRGAAITVLHDKLARMPRRLAKGSRELDSARNILRV